MGNDKKKISTNCDDDDSTPQNSGCAYHIDIV
jgi:hypothetical protein